MGEMLWTEGGGAGRNSVQVRGGVVRVMVGVEVRVLLVI